MNKIRVGIVGSSGYAGGELIRILAQHPHAEIAWLASRTHAGKSVSKLFPSLARCIEMSFNELDIVAMGKACDCIFAAVPQGTGMELCEEALRAGARFIDLGPDFRLKDPQEFKKWYKIEHTCPGLLAEAVYGLPELHRGDTAGARVVANPGCYPTGALLSTVPFLKSGVALGEPVVICSMSGVSGAGSTPAQAYHFPECTENVRPYGVAGHRHTPEIEQELSRVMGSKVTISFTPHLVPMSRGLLTTAVLRLAGNSSTDELRESAIDFYKDDHFIRVLPADELPQTKAVSGSNFCDLAVRADPRAGVLVAMSAIDNLGKGAAGQAVQNMNIMFGLSEQAGIDTPGLFP